jgi:hypothetical protein
MVRSAVQEIEAARDRSLPPSGLDPCASRRRSPIALPALALTFLGLAAAGCGGSSSKGLTGNFDADNGLAVHATVVAAEATSELALQAALARMDPAWQPVAGPTGSTSGTATNGQVTLDFGSAFSSGTDVDGATLRGSLTATYARSGSSATVSVSFSSLTITTNQLGQADVTGGLTMTVTFNGTTANGTITGAVTTSSPSEQATVTPNVTYSLPGGATATVVQNGTLGYTGSARGSWTVALGNLTAQANPAPRTINSGSVTLARTSGSAVTVSLVFAGPNQGTVTTSPDSTSKSFKL